MGEIARPQGTAERLFRIWASPIEPMLERIGDTADKPLAELTMTDLLTWAFVLGYAAMTGLVVGQLAGNLIVSAVRGPVRLR